MSVAIDENRIWTEPIIQRADGSYVATVNGYPYHVPNEDEFAELWAEIDAWAEEHPDDVAEEDLPPPPTLEETRAGALERLRLKKWERKDAGITVGGVQIDTDDKGQATISGAVMNVMLDSSFTATWKTAATDENGGAVWMELDGPALIALARALTLYTEACFAVEAAKQAELAALDSVADVQAWLEESLDTGWPSQIMEVSDE